MKVNNKVKFDVVVASHLGMCFGVKAAISTAHELSAVSPVTILGELAHNASVKKSLELQGARHSNLNAHKANTKNVIITAHGASDKERSRWKQLGHKVTDTTCPLVHRAHSALKNLVSSGYTPIVIGKANHVEVKGLMGDFPSAQSVMSLQDVASLRIDNNKIGIVSQTTQQIDHADQIVNAIKKRFINHEVRFVDTICRPTKDRQAALIKLCTDVQLVIVVGGANSNNTAQLAMKCRHLGCTAYHVQAPSDIQNDWFKDIYRVGLTAGTSTPDKDIDSVRQKLIELSLS